MLTKIINDFLSYLENVDFKPSSLNAASSRLAQFQDYCQIKNIVDIQNITYADLLTFITEFGYCSIHVKKSRIWTLHQFYHFLTLKEIVNENIAVKLPYPKIVKTVPRFLKCDEFNKILLYFTQKSNEAIGLRNLVIVMMMGVLGFRISTIARIDIEDIDFKNKTIRIMEKGSNTKRLLPAPDILFSYLLQYIWHSFATEMYLQKVPPEDIRAMMGHDKIEETARYIHIPMHIKQKALQQITISGENYGC